jgi:hypothetical protein
VDACRVDFIQMRNLNLDPEIYLALVEGKKKNEGRMGLNNFMKRLQKNCPWIEFGYFNPYLSG